MKKLSIALIILTMVTVGLAQKNTVKNIFAVTNDGKTLTPIAKVEKGKILQSVSGSDSGELITDFVNTYYKPKTVYNLIFGGKKNGTVTVVSSDPNSDCSRNMAEVSTASDVASLKGFVMALATDYVPSKASSGTRRKPTTAERQEIEKLVSAELARNKVTAKPLRYHNLTALDVNNDKNVEMVGSYWVASSKTSRALLFFIAEKGTNGKFAFTAKDFSMQNQKDLMNGEISTVDQGIYHELLLDVFDYNDDGTAEIFTYGQGFEGDSYNVYQKVKGKWIKALEASNYRCGF